MVSAMTSGETPPRHRKISSGCRSTSFVFSRAPTTELFPAALARLRGLDHFRGFGPLKINELIKKVFTTAGAGARAAEWSLGRDLGIADQRESAEGACERQSDTFRLSWQ